MPDSAGTTFNLPPMPTKRQVREFLQWSDSALNRALAAGRIKSIKLGSGKSAPVRIPRDQMLEDVGLIENVPSRRRRNLQAEREKHAAAARFGLNLEDNTTPRAAAP